MDEYQKKEGKASVMDCPSKGATAGCSLSNFGSEAKTGIRHGHPGVYKILTALGDLHSKKNHDYAGGGPPMGNFDRRAEIYRLYPNLDLTDPVVIALVDMLKQLDAVLWMKATNYEGTIEGIKSRLRDIALYSVLAEVLEMENQVPIMMLDVPPPKFFKKVAEVNNHMDNSIETWNEDRPDNPKPNVPDHC